MLKPLPTLAIAALMGAAPGAAQASTAAYGPPRLDEKLATAPAPRARGAFSRLPPYPYAESLLAANGVTIADGSARRPIAPNTDLAVERAKGLVDKFGDAKKPMRLLLRVGTRF
jgi:hypothetical protein